MPEENTAVYRYSVIIDGPFDASFSYECSQSLQTGDVVQIPFGKRNVVGVVSNDPVDETRELKSIAKKFDYNIGENNFDFLNWVAAYTLAPRGNVLKMLLAEKTLFSVKKADETRECNFAFGEISLNSEQQSAYKEIISAGAQVFLIDGVTGSGKTEIYLKFVQDILRQGKQVLIMLPEIALTNQLQERIRKYFGAPPLVYNSNITPKNRRQIWQAAISGKSCLVIGARSSLFLPFKNLGLIVADEEHDSSYKQGEGVIYNARDMAVVRGHLQKIPIILASATPSLESYINAKAGKYKYIELKKRYGESQLPVIKFIDMRQKLPPIPAKILHGKVEKLQFISRDLFAEIVEKIRLKEQVLVYVNRRGYSPITLCKSCGAKLECPDCSSWLVYHKGFDALICHYCGHKTKIPSKCASCDAEDSYIPFGAGVERIYDELKKKLPAAHVEIASSDTMSNEKNRIQLFQKISSGEVDIIIGTQILAKGHHFPNITLVGVIDGDLGLQGADIRASERTYQMINQVAGRAGRGEKNGKIIIQTYNPEHPLYKTMQQGENFMILETNFRKAHNLPPFSQFISLIISGTNHELTEKTAKMLCANAPKNLQIFGPAPAPLFLLRGRARWRILVKSKNKSGAHTAIKNWLVSKKIPKNIKVQVDVDPYSFL